jgi:putative addiction module component (TIGR02574 family)
MVRPAIDLAQLSVSQRLALIQAVWDSLRARPDALPVNDEERALIAARREEHRRDPGGAIPWEQVRAELCADQERDEADQGAGERGG